MDLNELIPIFGILLVMIPVAGLTFGLTLRLAVKPFVETLTKAMRESGGAANADEASGRITMLQDEVEALAREVSDLKRGQDFDRRLESASAGAAGTDV